MISPLSNMIPSLYIMQYKLKSIYNTMCTITQFFLIYTLHSFIVACVNKTRRLNMNSHNDATWNYSSRNVICILSDLHVFSWQNHQNDPFALQFPLTSPPFPPSFPKQANYVKPNFAELSNCRTFSNALQAGDLTHFCQ